MNEARRCKAPVAGAAAGSTRPILEDSTTEVNLTCRLNNRSLDVTSAEVEAVAYAWPGGADNELGGLPPWRRKFLEYSAFLVKYPRGIESRDAGSRMFLVLFVGVDVFWLRLALRTRAGYAKGVTDQRKSFL